MGRAACLVLLAACGDPATPVPQVPPDTAQSGTRLKLAWYELDDGFRTWADPTDLYDAELGTPCTPSEWADGVTRCTPQVAATAIFYLDAGCTQPAFAGADARFGAEYEPGCRGARPTTALYELGAAVVVGQAWQRTGTACVAVQLPPRQSTFVLQPIVGTRPPSDLVTMRVGYQGDAPVSIATLLGEDGLIVPWRPYDPAHHVTCDTGALERASDGPCIAVESLTFNWVFVGDECRTPVVSVEPQCARPPLAAFPTFSCPRYYSLAETPWTAASTCSPQPPPGTVYALESFVDPVWLTRAVEPAPTREQPIYVAGGSVRFRDPHRLFDADLITECEMSSATRFGEPARDGEDARCRPPLQAAYYKGSLFSDAACTQPLPDMVQVDGSDMCITRSPATYLPSFDGVFRIGARHEGVVYEMLPPTCNPVLDPLHELGELLPDTRLPHAIKRRDP